MCSGKHGPNSVLNSVDVRSQGFLTASTTATYQNPVQLHTTNHPISNQAQEHWWIASNTGPERTTFHENFRRFKAFSGLSDSDTTATFGILCSCILPFIRTRIRLKNNVGSEIAGPGLTTFHERVSEAVRRSQGFLTVT